MGGLKGFFLRDVPFLVGQRNISYRNVVKWCLWRKS